MINAFFKNNGFLCLYYLSFILLVLLFAFPISYLLINYFSLQSFTEVISTSYFRRIFFNTFKQAFLSALCSGLFALPFLFLVCRRSFRFKKFLLVTSYIPFVVPSIIMVLAFVLLFGKNSVFHNVNILYSLKAVILAHSFYNFPLVLHTVYSAYMKRSLKCENVAQTLGSKPLYTFCHFTLPSLKKPFFSSLLLAFMYSFSSFAIVLTLGGGVRNSTLEVEIYRNFKVSMDKEAGTAYAIVSFLFVLVFMILYKILFFKGRDEKAEKECVLKKGNYLDSFFALLLSFVVLLPFLEIVFSLFKGGFVERGRSATTSLERVFAHPEVFFNSLLIALFSSVIVLFFAFVIAEYNARYTRKYLSIFSFLPLSVSSIALSEGYRMFASDSYFKIILVSSLLNALFSFPLVYGIVEKGVDSIPLSVQKAPLTLGSSVLKAVFRVDLRAIRKVMMRAFALAFSLSIGEVSSALLFSSNNFATISTSIYSFISRYDYRSGVIMGVILLLFSSLSVFILLKERD